MVRGVVVRIFNDFLGKSLIVEHDLPNKNSSRFCTIYGHTNPLDGLHVGSIVKEGDIIATLADSIESKHHLLPHLHLSLGWISKYISYDQLNWETIGSRNTLALLDPLHVIGAHYSAL
jgi:murein DD-endopeptidase MepM/ murein hydrolase activator NlpD